jgi:hypothetical protein
LSKNLIGICIVFLDVEFRFVVEQPVNQMMIVNDFGPHLGITLVAQIPVQFIMPEYDHIWRGDSEALSHVTEIFTASPFIDIGIQRLTGHSIELHTLAFAFYKKVLAFVEECILYRANRSSL